MKNILFTAVLVLILASNYAQNTLIPDPKFEQYLINAAWDAPPIDGKVKTSTINKIGKLYISGTGITDLTGIEDFTSLTEFNADGERFKKVDLSNNKQLEQFSCSDCGLKELDLSTNLKLRNVLCNRNQLTKLVLPNTSTLTEVHCEKNELTSIVFPDTNFVDRFFCDSNRLEEIDIKNFDKLRFFTCNSNALKQLKLYREGRTYLEQLIVFSANNNPDLSCVQVGDSVALAWYNNFKKSDIDSTASYAKDCNYATGVEWVAPAAASLQLFPNPTTGQVQLIGYENTSVAIKVVDFTGQVVQHVTLENPAESFEIKAERGMYLVQVQSGSGSQRCFKVIKE